MTLREEIDLGGSWKFYPAFEPFTGDLRWMDPNFDPDKPDSLPEERRAGWTGAFFDDRGWLEIEVPGSWNASFEDLWSYEGHGWYRRRIAVPAAWSGRRVVFHSDGANYRTELFINGTRAGSHDGGHVPFSIPVDHLSSSAGRTPWPLTVTIPPGRNESQAGSTAGGITGACTGTCGW